MNLVVRLRESPWLQLVLLLGLTAAVLVTKFGNGLIYDDHAMIEVSDRIHQLSNIPAFFSHNTMWGASGEGLADHLTQLDTWRPVTMTTFALDAQLSGREPWAYHLTNLVWHLMAVALVFALGRSVLRVEERPWALVGAAFFAFHPALTEAHVWINGRSDVLAGVFGLAALVLSLRATAASSRGRAVGLSVAVGGALLLGCLSKEVVLMMTPLLPLSAWMFADAGATWRTRLRSALAASIAPAVAGGLYLITRTTVLSGMKAFGDASDRLNALSRLPLVLLSGLSTAVVPRNLYFRHLFEEFSGLDAWVFVAAAAGLIGIAVAAFVLRRRAPALVWGLAGFALVLLPASVIAVTSGWWGFNRYLYVPVALLAPGLAQLVAMTVAWLRAEGREPAVRWVSYGLIAYLGLEVGLTLLCIGEYHDEVRFYQAIVDQAPESSHGHAGLGVALVQQQRFEEAASELRIAMAIQPDYVPTRANLIVALTEVGAIDEARAVAERSVELWPQDLSFRQLLARTWMPDNPSVGVEILLTCLVIEPEREDARGDLWFAITEHPRHVELQAVVAGLLREPRFVSIAPQVGTLLEKARSLPAAAP